VVFSTEHPFPSSGPWLCPRVGSEVLHQVKKRALHHFKKANAYCGIITAKEKNSQKQSLEMPYSLFFLMKALTLS